MRKLYLFLIIFISYQLTTINESYAQWTDGGTLLTNQSLSHHRPIISPAENGDVYITWVGTPLNSGSNYGSILLQSLDSKGNIAQGWPQGGIIVTITQSGSYWAPEVITSEDGSAIIVWQGFSPQKNNLQIFAQKYSKDGLPIWNDGNPVTIAGTTSNNDEYPKLYTDRHKGFFVTWNRFDAAISTNSTDIYLQHIDSTGNPANGWTNIGIAIANMDGFREYYPRIVVSKDGQSIYIMYAWSYAGKESLWLKKFNASDGSIADKWTSDGIALTPGPDVWPDIMNSEYLFCDKDDNVIALWSESRSTGNGELYMQRLSPSGLKFFSLNGKYITGKSAINNGISYVDISQDADKNFLISYNNYDVSYDLGALKLAPSGDIIWELKNVTMNGNSAYPKPVSDGNKGMYIFYEYFINSTSFLHAIAIDSLGHLHNGWDLPGTYFGKISLYPSGMIAQPNLDFVATATKDGMATVAWNKIDGSFTNMNLYACNILNNGLNCTDPLNSVPEITSNQDIYIYPNPFSSSIIIQTSEFLPHTSYFILYDLTGRQILNKQIDLSLNQQSISACNLPNSLYFYSILSNNKILKKGILVKQ